MGETRFTGKVVKKLNEREGVFAINVHGSSYSIGQPDIVGCWHGLSFSIETKAKGKKLSKVQESVKRKWEAAGNRYFVVRDWDDYADTVSVLVGEQRELEKARSWATFMKSVPEVIGKIEQMRSSLSKGSTDSEKIKESG